MNEIKHPTTQLVWRSESKSDFPSPDNQHCSVQPSFRSLTIGPVLERLNIPVLNISEATCQCNLQQLDGSRKIGPHLCFPSPVLRHWLQVFQEQFLQQELNFLLSGNVISF
jgi:hypothetical protein